MGVIIAMHAWGEMGWKNDHICLLYYSSSCVGRRNSHVRGEMGMPMKDS